MRAQDHFSIMPPTRRTALCSALVLAAAPARAAGAGPEPSPLSHAGALADATPDLRTLIVAQQGVPQIERAWRGASLSRPENIKSAAKTIIATLAGIAAARGVFSLDDRIAPILGRLVPSDADPRVALITIRHLAGMRAGLDSTSGSNYGRWVASGNWLHFALARPFADEPGGQMIYSTGSSHILGAALARATGQSLRDLVQNWLGRPLGFAVPEWRRDPQGFYFGGNDMALAPRALLTFGECCRSGGRHQGRQVIPSAFLAEAWRPAVRSSFSGQQYGLGWWVGEAAGQGVNFAWGYGGQMLYVLPQLGLTVVMTSETDRPRVPGQVFTRHALLANGILPAFTR
ncbi:serine hydrolase [Roseomonas hellenica]|uniref:Serine hydrolase n=1 Tax=Plastoroseomonas hellenica TaxID=2687306 RepID=A0ABS5EVX2_9PROT|nr:serine hydrolase [Plastoroseomonas hellenica]MBR0664429.1 serine hydrolase [Plastoroseomonas hellenica]